MDLKKLLPASVILLAACAAPVKEQEQTGFISDYSRLQKGDDQRYSYISDKLAGSQNFLIDPVTMLYRPDPENRKFTDEELEEMKQFFVDELTEALTSGENHYGVVEKPGPGVARFRLAITALDPTVGALNVNIATKLTGAGLGGVAVEMETVDAETGEQLAALIRWGSGSRVMPGGFTKAGHAKTLIRRWVRNLRKELDELNGRA